MFKNKGVGLQYLLNILMCCLILCLSILPLSAFNQASQPSIIRLYELANKLYNPKKPGTVSDQQAINYFLTVADSAPDSLQFLKIESLIKAGNIYLSNEKLDSCNLLYHRALAENKQPNKKVAYNYEAYFYLGSSMYFGNILDSAQYYFELASDISEKYTGIIKLPEQDRLYNSLGAMYYEAANFQQAKDHFETALEFASPQIKDTHGFFTTIKNNIGNCLVKLHRYDEAIKLFKSIKPKGKQKNIVQQSLANAYFEKGKYDSSLNIYQFIQKSGAELSIASLNNIGRIYAGRMAWKKAQAAFKIAHERSRLNLPTLKNKEEALTYLYQSELSAKLGLYEQAIDYVNEALIEVHFDFNPTSRYDLPSNVEASVSPITSHQIIIFKANLIYQRYRSTRDNNLLLAAHQTFIKGVETSNLIARTMDNDDAKLFFLQNTKKLFTNAIQVAFEATRINSIYIEDYIYILEHYKGNILQQNLEQLQLKSTSKIPAPLLEKEQRIKQAYAIYLSKLSQVNTEAELAKIQKKLSTLQNELSRLQRDYNDFKGNKWISKSLIDKSITVKKIQKNIGNNQALINYFTATNELYILCITRQKAEVKKVITGRKYHGALGIYINENFNFTEGFRYNGYEAAYALYGYLIAPVARQIKSKLQLIIIPDGHLFQLPFDGLIKSPDTKSFLVRSHAISYHYSIALLINQPDPVRSGKSQKKILAFAPFASYNAPYDSLPQLAELPYSKSEINQQGATLYLNNKATKVKFLQNYEDYKILHMATHASLGPDSSDNWIQFAPTFTQSVADKLYVYEIYNLNLSESELIILSACESGNGQLANGEGVLSLSRAFMYAGAKGIVTTLYKSDDFVTAYIIKRLYHHMKAGSSPQEALRKSKIDFLDDDEVNVRLKKPGYWSNFVYVGEISQLKDTGMLGWSLLLSGIIIATLILCWLLNKSISKY